MLTISSIWYHNVSQDEIHWLNRINSELIHMKIICVHFWVLHKSRPFSLISTLNTLIYIISTSLQNILICSCYIPYIYTYLSYKKIPVNLPELHTA